MKWTKRTALVLIPISLTGWSGISFAYRPFDARANGYVPGEGGAILLVEELEYAQKRGVPQIYGEIAGYAATHDGQLPTVR